MKIISHKNTLKKIVNNQKNLGFVPTMGAIHKGHISLIRKCVSQCNKTIVTIFINKPQFNRKIDFVKYPRVLKNDIKILKEEKVDYLYLPTNKQIYPNGPSKNIKIDSFCNKLCGKFRPGHFHAIVDVIDRFIKIIKPKKIFLGRKDFQQLKIVEDYVKKNYKKIKIVGCVTIREKNGIAYSSRNALLSTKEKKIASTIFQVLKSHKHKLIKKKLSIKKIKSRIIKLGISKLDYLEVLDVNKLIPPFIKKNKYKIFISYYLRKTRLIDNI